MTREDCIKAEAKKYYSEDIKCYNAFLHGIEFTEENQWISVNNDLPYNHKELIESKHYTKKVLVVLSWNNNIECKHIGTSYISDRIGSYDVDWSWWCDVYYSVTHWMPLPELPKE